MTLMRNNRIKNNRFLIPLLLLIIYACNERDRENKVVGTWEPVGAIVKIEDKKTYPYGLKPKGRLIFTKEMQFLEFIIDSRIPPYKSDVRGNGTDEENRRLIQGSFSLYGT